MTSRRFSIHGLLGSVALCTVAVCSAASVQAGESCTSVTRRYGVPCSERTLALGGNLRFDVSATGLLRIAAPDQPAAGVVASLLDGTQIGALIVAGGPRPVAGLVAHTYDAKLVLRTASSALVIGTGQGDRTGPALADAVRIGASANVLSAVQWYPDTGTEELANSGMIPPFILWLLSLESDQGKPPEDPTGTCEQPEETESEEGNGSGDDRGGESDGGDDGGDDSGDDSGGDTGGGECPQE